MRAVIHMQFRFGAPDAPACTGLSR
jgi:hypothetical protein